MKFHLHKLLITLLGVAIASIIMSGCGAGAPPTPPIEAPVPLVIKFVQYDDMKTDYSTISNAPAALASSKYVGPGGEYSDVIAHSPFIYDLHGSILDKLLSSLEEISVPVDTSVTEFETTNVNDPSMTYKIDFSIDIDIDGDGLLEGCSGSTGALPVCALIWINDDRFLAWVFDTYPYVDGTLAGTGRVRIYTSSEMMEESLISLGLYELLEEMHAANIAGLSYAANYSTETSESRTLQSASRTTFAEQTIILEKAYNTYGDIQSVSTQSGPDISAFKLLKIREDQLLIPIDEGQEFDLFFTSVSQYKEGDDYWSGSWIDELYYLDMLSIDSLFGEGTNVCARISTGNAAEDPTICDSLGISVEGIPLITQPLQENDVQLPPQMPATPPF